MKRVLLGAVAALGLSLGAANAADLLGGGSSGAFDGFYLGAQGGYTFGEIGGPVDLSTKGPSAGGFVGWGAVLSGTYYVGVEGAFDYGDVKNKTSGVGEIKRDMIGAVTGRLGYLAEDSILLYAQGGYARARVKVKDDLSGVNDDDWFHGVRVGVGLEQQYGQGLFGRVAVDADILEEKQRSGTAKAGLGYRF